MFSIMYDKQTGEVLTICSGNFIIPEGCGLLKMDNIPDYNMDTQQLIVENDTLIVKDRQLTQEEKDRIALEQMQTKIDILKQQLATTDYKAIKYAEGLLTEEEYQPIKTQRQTWRKQINDLEKEVQQCQY